MAKVHSYIRAHGAFTSTKWKIQLPINNFYEIRKSTLRNLHSRLVPSSQAFSTLQFPELGWLQFFDVGAPTPEHLLTLTNHFYIVRGDCNQFEWKFNQGRG